MTYVRQGRLGSHPIPGVLDPIGDFARGIFTFRDLFDAAQGSGWQAGPVQEAVSYYDNTLMKLKAVYDRAYDPGDPSDQQNNQGPSFATAYQMRVVLTAPAAVQAHTASGDFRDTGGHGTEEGTVVFDTPGKPSNGAGGAQSAPPPASHQTSAAPETSQMQPIGTGAGAGASGGTGGSGPPAPGDIGIDDGESVTPTPVNAPGAGLSPTVLMGAAAVAAFFLLGGTRKRKR